MRPELKLSLRPLKFKKAVIDLLKVKPPEKPPKSKRQQRNKAK
jgi:hypothetical protein